jgi:catechol 2,3-dioxygenase-like lactoylglutathione lyase family enzyme
MLRGLTTVNFFADDLAAARDWYTEVLGVEPYFVREVAGAPAYIEFRVGDYQHELGFIDVRAAFDRLLSLGATAHQEPIERGPGFVTASVVDPFGNVLGVMFNQHYLDVLAPDTSGTE